MRREWRVTARPPRPGRERACQLLYAPPYPQKRYQRSARTRDLAAAKLQAEQEEARLNGRPLRCLEGRASAPADLLRACVAGYCELSELAPATRTRYRQAARLLAEVLERREGEQLDKQRLVLVRDELRRRGLAARTINRSLAIARAAWGWGFERGLVPYPWPKLKPLRVRATQLRPLTRDELALLLRAAKGYQGGKHAPLVLLLMATGARSGEVVQLRERDLDRERGEVRFRAATTKARRARVVAVPLEVLEQVPRAANPDAPAFPGAGGGARSTASAYGCFRRIVRAAGLEGEPIGGLHSLRRTWIAEAFRAGVGLAGLMRHVGHETARVTLGYAAQAADLGERDAAAEVVANLGLVQARPLRVLEGRNSLEAAR